MSAEIAQEEQNRLKHFPIMMFAIVMGLGGITILYQKAAQWLHFPHLIAQSLMYLTTIVFFVISFIYLVKYSKYKMAVQKEFNHPIRINFFAAISISMLMLAIIYKEEYSTIAAIFWYPATLLHFVLTLYTISFWINENQEIAHSNPAWFIPIVGNVLVPVGGVGFVSTNLLMYFFSVGLFFWIVLFAIILNRIIFHHQLAVKFMPTLFILIAPPAVGVIAYFKLYHTYDTFAVFLYNIALFFTLLIAFMYKNFLKMKFFISWWAFVFPIAAMAIATMLTYKITHDIVMLYFSYILIAVASIIVLIVVYQTIKNIQAKNICKPE
jgi:tellurite resistance protein